MNVDLRLKKEMTMLSGSDLKDIGLLDVDENRRNFVAFIKGPSDSPFQGGFFKLAIHITPQYPYEAPKVRFLTKIWHPNISSQTGAICLDILKDAWTPAFTLKSTLLSIEALLTAAEPTDPQDAQVASQYMNNFKEYTETAAQWTAKYAKQNILTEAEADIASLMALGYSKNAVHNALNDNHWTKEKALQQLKRRK
ncbi:hypothetical protein WA158_008039 [Blastocystis sp. Blastoise]